MDLSKVRSQLEELASRGTEHGNQFDGFDKLIIAYQVYIDKYSSWNSDRSTQHWCKVVGGAQKGLPVRALQEYLRSDRIQPWVSKTKEERTMVSWWLE